MQEQEDEIFNHFLTNYSKCKIILHITPHELIDKAIRELPTRMNIGNKCLYIYQLLICMLSILDNKNQTIIQSFTSPKRERSHQQKKIIPFDIKQAIVILFEQMYSMQDQIQSTITQSLLQQFKINKININ
jgi:hypothetical protein